MIPPRPRDRGGNGVARGRRSVDVGGMRHFDEILLDQPDAVRLAFLEVLNWMLAADGVADPREVRFLDDLATRLGFAGLRGALPTGPQDWKPAWTEILAPVARYVLLHCALLAWEDDTLHANEVERLAALCHALQIDATRRDEAIAWARDGRRWMREGFALLAADPS